MLNVQRSAAVRAPFCPSGQGNHLYSSLGLLTRVSLYLIIRCFFPLLRGRHFVIWLLVIWIDEIAFHHRFIHFSLLKLKPFKLIPKVSCYICLCFHHLKLPRQTSNRIGDIQNAACSQIFTISNILPVPSCYHWTRLIDWRFLVKTSNWMW